MRQQGISLRLLEERSHRHVYRVLVLLQPTINRVGDNAGVVLEVEVGLEAGALLRLGLGERGMLAQVLLVQLVLEGHVSCLWHDALLFEDGKDTYVGSLNLFENFFFFFQSTK